MVKSAWPPSYHSKNKNSRNSINLFSQLQHKLCDLFSDYYFFTLPVHSHAEVKKCCDRKSRAVYAQSFALWQQATIGFTCHDHSPRTLVVTFNGSQANIGRASTPRSLYYCLFAPHICMVLFYAHIPFVVNHTINATPPESLQQ